MIKRLLCWLTGHVRGKRVTEIDGVATFRCPRCGASWSRKLRKPKAA
jgi:uncharacterized C2H2 Zn-finger protein